MLLQNELEPLLKAEGLQKRTEVAADEAAGAAKPAAAKAAVKAAKPKPTPPGSRRR